MNKTLLEITYYDLNPYAETTLLIGPDLEAALKGEKSFQGLISGGSNQTPVRLKITPRIIKLNPKDPKRLQAILKHGIIEGDAEWLLYYALKLEKHLGC